MGDAAPAGPGATKTARSPTVSPILLALTFTSLSCGGTSPFGATAPLGPTLPVTGPAATVTSISPSSGSVIGGTPVQITGTNFKPGARVSVGEDAQTVVVVSSTTITATTSFHAVGTVDVLVINPVGAYGRLPGAYSYVNDPALSLTARPSKVPAGGQLSVSWTTPSGRIMTDWIGLFEVGDPNMSYEKNWWGYTKGATSGTMTMSAPSRAAQYEFRYLPEDGYIDVIRSAVVTVTP